MFASGSAVKVVGIFGVSTVTTVAIAFGSAQEVGSVVLNPQTGITTGLVIELGMLVAALFGMFKAGAVFGTWKQAADKMMGAAKKLDAMDARIGELEKHQVAARTAHELELAKVRREVANLQLTTRALEGHIGLNRRDLGEGA